MGAATTRALHAAPLRTCPPCACACWLAKWRFGSPACRRHSSRHEEGQIQRRGGTAALASKRGTRMGACVERARGRAAATRKGSFSGGGREQREEGGASKRGTRVGSTVQCVCSHVLRLLPLSVSCLFPEADLHVALLPSDPPLAGGRDGGGEGRMRERGSNNTRTGCCCPCAPVPCLCLRRWLQGRIRRDSFLSDWRPSGADSQKSRPQEGSPQCILACPLSLRHACAAFSFCALRPPPSGGSAAAGTAEQSSEPDGPRERHTPRGAQAAVGTRTSASFLTSRVHGEWLLLLRLSGNAVRSVAGRRQRCDVDICCCLLRRICCGLALPPSVPRSQIPRTTAVGKDMSIGALQPRARDRRQRHVETVPRVDSRGTDGSVLGVHNAC